jgi:hypothetical protein
VGGPEKGLVFYPFFSPPPPHAPVTPPPHPFVPSPTTISPLPPPQVKLADFGVARKLGGTSDLSKTFVGTVGYMSPERIQGMRYNAKADVWGFGLALLACALGGFPYQVGAKADRGASGGPGVGPGLLVSSHRPTNPSPINQQPTTTQRQVSSMSYFELATAVCDEPSPTLPADNPFSPHLRDFLRLCLLKDPATRPSAATLLSHPFLLRVSRAPSSSSASTSASASASGVDRPASPYGSKVQRAQLARRELQQVADALAAHFGGTGTGTGFGTGASGSGSSSGIGSSRRPSGLVRVSSSSASGVGAGGGLGMSGSGTTAVGAAVGAAVGGGAAAAGGGGSGLTYVITAWQLRRLGENLRVELAVVREALQARLQGLVVLEGTGIDACVADDFIRPSLSSSSLGLGLSGSAAVALAATGGSAGRASWMGPQHQQHHAASSFSSSSSVSPTRRMSSLMRQSTGGLSSSGGGPEAAAAAATITASSPLARAATKGKGRGPQFIASAAGWAKSEEKRHGQARRPRGAGCCHMM